MKKALLTLSLLLLAGCAQTPGTPADNQPLNQQASANPAATVAPTAVPTPVSPMVWKTYTNAGDKFTIQYPARLAGDNQDWIFENIKVAAPALSAVGFGTPASKAGGYVWGINVFTKSKVATETLIKQVGSQFKDRQEKRENITVDGKPALLVTVTTNMLGQGKWIAKTVYIELGDKLYVLGNGALLHDEFMQFYNSMKFTA